ncbi:PLATZ transcription factor family protein [Forsythia ovata]|uniref:PLATZ transcription factor family protein n=1 Tax=Forsythia ovata TaxID=205694 RepID=A0ABD1RSM2_9LAMI
MVPRWLEPLLKIKFYSEGPCQLHRKKYYETFFCYECMGKPLCEICWSSSEEHRLGHPLLKVYRDSQRAALLISDISKFLDISDIQPFVINNSQILYLNSDVKKENHMPNKGHYCDTCFRQIKNPKYKLCSIGCKIKSNKNNIELYDEKYNSKKRKKILDSSRDVPLTLRASNEVEIRENNPSEEAKCERIRNRKGIPLSSEVPENRGLSSSRQMKGYSIQHPRASYMSSSGAKAPLTSTKMARNLTKVELKHTPPPSISHSPCR